MVRVITGDLDLGQKGWEWEGLLRNRYLSKTRGVSSACRGRGQVLFSPLQGGGKGTHPQLCPRRVIPVFPGHSSPHIKSDLLINYAHMSGNKCKLKVITCGMPSA